MAFGLSFFYQFLEVPKLEKDLLEIHLSTMEMRHERVIKYMREEIKTYFVF
jgi:hypothetical protein